MTNKEIMSNNKKVESYTEAKRRGIEARSRLRLGFEQLIYRPYYNIFLLVMCIPFLIAWKRIDSFLPTDIIPERLLAPCHTIISAWLFIMLILCELVIIRVIGILTARKFESNLSIVFADSYECPIMRSCRTNKRDKVTVYEFYSEISKHEWEKKMVHIAERNNIHFIAPQITYGGKHANDGRFIKIYTQKGILPPERGIMHDTEI